VLKLCSQRIYLLKLLRDQGLPCFHLNTIFDALVLSRLRYVILAWSGFLSAELKGNINSFLKRSFKYGFCTGIYAVAQEADRLLFTKMAIVINIASTFCCLILNLVIIALDQRAMLISCPDVTTNCIRDHLYRGVFLVMCSFYTLFVIVFSFPTGTVYMYVSYLYE